MPQELNEYTETNGLWLTDRLLAQIRSSSSLGVSLMVICLLLGISSALYTIYRLSLLAEGLRGNFYLLEADNLFTVVFLLVTASLFYFFARAIMDGHRA